MIPATTPSARSRLRRPGRSDAPGDPGAAAAGEATVNELVAPIRSQPADHLQASEGAGARRARLARAQAQFRPVRLNAAPLAGAAGWLGDYRRFWAESLDRLDDYVKEMKRKEGRHASKRSR